MSLLIFFAGEPANSSGVRRLEKVRRQRRRELELRHQRRKETEQEDEMIVISQGFRYG